MTFFLVLHGSKKALQHQRVLSSPERTHGMQRPAAPSNDAAFPLPPKKMASSASAEKAIVSFF